MPYRCEPSKLRPWVYYCLFGLLSVSGLRLGEARNLELQDVDLKAAVLTIRGAKFGKTRLVPLHASKPRMPDFGILLLRSTGDTFCFGDVAKQRGQYTGRKNALWPWRKESRYAIFCSRGRHHARKKFSFERTTDSP
jgi:hypothetical protein